MQDIINLATKLIQIPSEAENPKALQQSLDMVLSYLQDYTIEHFEKNGVKSALVYNASVRPESFKLLLNAHLDIVPGKSEQYLPRIDGDYLYGVGAMDMKGNLACLVKTFQETAHSLNYPVALQLTTDEEIGGINGSKHQVDEGVRAEFVLAGEPTNFDIVHKAKGVLWLKAASKGSTAHGAYPWRGKNAVSSMIDFLKKLEKNYPNPANEQWTTTINISSLDTKNLAMNKIPDHCISLLDIRYIEEDNQEILNRIKSLASPNESIEVLMYEPALSTNKNNRFLKRLQDITHQKRGEQVVLRGANGTSDARHFARVNNPGIEFGPIGGGIGSDQEWVSISSLEQYHKIIKEFIQNLP